jgi:AraC-like DNA-binding protein
MPTISALLYHPRASVAKVSFSARVRELLGDGTDPGISHVARQLGVGRRTLQRALTAEGTSYSAIAAAMRRAAAEQLLARGDLAICEVAHALGFAEVPAFYRAFTRWTGTTPGAFRAERSKRGHGAVDPELAFVDVALKLELDSRALGVRQIRGE